MRRLLPALIALKSLRAPPEPGGSHRYESVTPFLCALTKAPIEAVDVVTEL